MDNCDLPGIRDVAASVVRRKRTKNRFCEAKGLTTIEGNYLRITDVVEEWLGKADFAKMQEIFAFWQKQYMASSAEAQLILRLLLLVPEDQWLTSQSA